MAPSVMPTTAPGAGLLLRLAYVVGITRICCCLLTIDSLPTEAAAFWTFLEAVDLVTALMPRVARLVALSMTSANTDTKDGSAVS